jgi:raffinose/stachyose/melibiose transport system permease protein
MIIGFLLFTIYPIIWVLRYSVYEYDGMTEPIFIGLENFVRVFTRSPDFWQSMVNSLLLTMGVLLIETTLALLLAVFLNSSSKVNSLFRTVFFMPTIISSAIIGVIFAILFSSFNGIINNILIQFNIIGLPVDWFADKWHALLVLFIAQIWSSFGITMVYFLMGLQGIPKELYECAEIDGANKVQQFFKVTIPMLAPVLQIVLMLAIINGMKMTDLALVLTNGTPAGKSEVVMTYIYKYFFSSGVTTATAQFGYASAMAVVTAFVVGIITILYMQLSNKMKKIY